MRILSITLKGFRNLKKTELSFGADKDIFVFLGSNGQGKTNLLEAMHLLALSKSFRTRTNTDLVGFDGDFCSVKAQVGGATSERELEFVISKTPAQKALKINGVKKSAPDFVGNLKAVFFSPDDLSEMSFAPRLRRRYLDVLLSQLDQDYMRDLMGYDEARKQRNALLKSIREKSVKAEQLDFWDGKLAELGMRIIQRRRDLIDGIQGRVAQHYREIAQTQDEASLKYLSDEEIADADGFMSKLRRNREREIMMATTEVGPHRDDLAFFLNEHDMSLFASRGEWRSMVLALKFAEIDLIREDTGESPVLLLDDVFSELDDQRQRYLFEAVKGSQTFITTTHREFIKEGVDAQVLEVKEGSVLT